MCAYVLVGIFLVKPVCDGMLVAALYLAKADDG